MVVGNFKVGNRFLRGAVKEKRTRCCGGGGGVRGSKKDLGRDKMAIVTAVSINSKPKSRKLLNYKFRGFCLG